MSTILKALRRLEEEKSSGTARSLDEQVVAPRPPEVRSRRWPVVGAAMIAGMGVGSLALYLWFEPAAAPPLEMPAPEVSETARVQPELPARAAAPSTEPARAAKARPVPNRPARSVASTIEVVKRMGEEPSEEVESTADVSVAAAGPSANPGEPDPKNAPGVDAELAAGTTGAAGAIAETALAPALVEAQTLADAPSPVSPAAPGSTYAAEAPSVEPKAAVVDTPPTRSAPEPNSRTQLVSRQAELETVAASQPIEVAAEELQVATVPTASRPPAAVADPAPPPRASPTPEVSQRPEHKTIVRAQLPELSVASTTWHPDARRRSAVVNLTDSNEELLLREGDAVGPLVVEMIEPGGVFFAHDGIAVRYNVGR